ncbi:MAG: hypothetical protein M1832_002488 [Thelocarpon impressellum]|nr:MAG: hypothetical protein M1832_002488 [Thelocarpon impressellum]
MFRFHKTLDVITLFHRPGVPASQRVLSLLKQASATASAHVTEDQASDHEHQNIAQRSEFELNVTEDPPTSDQLRSIFEYLGPQRAGDLVKGARDQADAMRKLKESADNFTRPVTVDWDNGKAVVGDSESEILKLLRVHPEQP